MAQHRQRPKGDFVVEIGDAHAGNGQYFQVNSKEDYEVAMAAKDRMRSNIEAEVAARIQGTNHRRELAEHEENAMIRRQADAMMADGRTALPAYQTALRQEINERLSKERRAEQMAEANRRGVERGNLKVQEKQTADIER